MEIKVFNGKKSLNLHVKKTGQFSRGLGLMFKTRNTESLLFNFHKDVRVSFTGLFVFFPFLVLWLDGKNKVVDKRIVRPFELSVKARIGFRRVVEVPVNDENKEILKFFVEKSRKV